MYERPQRSDELYHWGSNGKHKYIKKIGQGKDARYFYSQEEIKAYMQGAKKGIQSGVNNVKNFFDPQVAKNYQNKLSDSDYSVRNKRFLVRSASDNMRDKTRSEASRKNMSKLKRIEELDLNKELNNREKTRKEYQKKTLSGVVDKITGDSYKKEMKNIKRDLDWAKEDAQFFKNERNKILKEKDGGGKHPGWKRAAEMADSDYKYEKSQIKNYTNDLNSTKRAYEKNSVAGKLEKIAGDTKKAVNDSINKSIKSVKKVPKNVANKGKDFINRIKKRK